MAREEELMAVLGEYHDRFVAVAQDATTAGLPQVAHLALEAWKKMQGAETADDARKVAEDFLNSPKIVMSDDNTNASVFGG